MGRARINRKRFPCGHKGFGLFCHRCQFADTLEELLGAGKSYTNHKSHKKPHTFSKAEMKAEIKRLREEGKVW